MLSLTYDLGLNVVMRDFARLNGGNGSQWSALETPGVLHEAGKSHCDIKKALSPNRHLV